MNQTGEKKQPPRAAASRRRFVQLAGGGIGLLWAAPLPARGQSPAAAARILQRGDRVELDVSCEEIVRKAYELGHAYEKKHGGCARCTVAALQDAIPFVAVDESLFRGATCLDGGATPTNVQNCGAFTGAGMVIGYVCGSTRGETFEGNAALAHQLLHKVYHRFAEQYGTVLCRDVRKGANGDCPAVVGRAAEWVAEVLLREFADWPDENKTGETPADEQKS